MKYIVLLLSFIFIKASAQKSVINEYPCDLSNLHVPDTIDFPLSFFEPDSLFNNGLNMIYTNMIATPMHRLLSILNKTILKEKQEDERGFTLRLRHTHPDYFGAYTSSAFKVEPVKLAGKDTSDYILSFVLHDMIFNNLDTANFSIDSALSILSNEIAIFDQFNNELNIHTLFQNFNLKDNDVSNHSDIYEFPEKLADTIYIDPHQKLSGGRFKYILSRFSNPYEDLWMFLDYYFERGLSEQMYVERVSFKKNAQVITELAMIESSNPCPCHYLEVNYPKVDCFYISTLVWRKYLK
jgi:hypothetical protein